MGGLVRQYGGQEDWFFFFFQAEDGIRDVAVTGVSDVCSSDLGGDDERQRGSFHKPVGLSHNNQRWNPPVYGQREVERRVAGEKYKRQRSEEHTSELQSRLHLVCRLLLEKKKKLRAAEFEAVHTQCS